MAMWEHIGQEVEWNMYRLGVADRVEVVVEGSGLNQQP